MIARMLYIILGAVIYLCSTPAGMAQKTTPVEARAFCLSQGELSDEDEQQADLVERDMALLGGAEGANTADNTVNGGKDRKRAKKRADSQKTYFQKPLMSHSLVAERATEHDVRCPEREDAREQRVAVIRWLEREALACFNG